MHSPLIIDHTRTRASVSIVKNV